MNLIEAIMGIGGLLLSGYAAFAVTKYKVDRAVRDEHFQELAHKSFEKEVKSYLDTLNISIREHIVIQQVTTTTLSSLVNRLEKISDVVNEHTIHLAIIKDRENHG